MMRGNGPWHPIVPYVHFKSLLTPEECMRVIAIGKAIGMATATTAGGNTLEIRRSEVAWLHQQDGTQWLFDKLAFVADEVNRTYFPCEVTHFAEPLQITYYSSEMAGHYAWHQDIGDGMMRTRKLSVTIALTPDDDYDGGDLEIFSAPEPVKIKECEQGTAIAFPSYTYHRVLPVTKGTRWSLVSWMHGSVWC